MKFTKLIASMMLAFTLAACGGGNDRSEASGDGPGVTPPELAELAQYAGSWSTDCEASNDAEIDGQPAYERVSAQATSNGLDLGLAITIRLYQPNDTTCSGPIAATHAKDGLIEYIGVADVRLDTQMISGHFVSWTLNPIDGILAPTTVTVNGIVYPGDYFATTERYDAYMAIDQGNIFLGASDTLVSSANYIGTRQ